MFISGNSSDGQQRWPFLFIAIAWAYFIAPKLTIEAPMVPITSLEAKTGNAKPLGRFADVAGVVIFVLVILGFIFNKYVGQPTWFIAFAGVMLMVICGTLSKNEAIKAIPVDICMLFVGANTMATALVGTGTADFIGEIISASVGGAANTFVLHGVFFIVPFVITQFMQNQSDVKPCVLEARERGVIFDLSHGTNAYSYDTAEAAWKAGFFTDTPGI